MTISPSEAGEIADALFPHRHADGKPAYRRHQRQTIVEILVALGEASISNVFVEAPTGAGKTSIIVTVAKAMARGGDQAHMITSMKMLQDAYLLDDPHIALVKGKNAYTCDGELRRRTTMKMSCEEIDIAVGHTCKSCGYRLARERALKAPIALHNFDSFLYQNAFADVFPPRKLLTIDEAHNIEEKMRTFVSVSLLVADFARLGLRWALPDFESRVDVITWARGAGEEIEEALTTLKTRLVTLRQDPRAPESEIIDVVKRLRGGQLLFDRLRRLWVSMSYAKCPQEWRVVESEASRVVLEPVNAGIFAHRALFQYGQKRVLTSATLFDACGEFAYSISLNPGLHITVPSTFDPARRRLTAVADVGDLSFRHWKQNLPAAAAAVKRIVDLHAHERGVVHCTSYAMVADLQRLLGGEKRLIFYRREEREAVIGKFLRRELADDVVLVAVALGEGYDLKDDICRFQILVRVPYPVPTPCIEARMGGSNYFYGWKTALTLVQAYGRGMRSEDDWCHTYILDSRFRSFIKSNREQLPSWFLEAIWY